MQTPWSHGSQLPTRHYIGRWWFHYSIDCVHVAGIVWPPCCLIWAQSNIYGRDLSGGIYLHTKFCAYKYQEVVNSYWHGIVWDLSRALPNTCRIDAELLDFARLKCLLYYIRHLSFNFCHVSMIFILVLFKIKEVFMQLCSEIIQALIIIYKEI